MTYIDSFVAPVPTAKRQEYIRHAETIAPLFREYGALAYTEAGRCGRRAKCVTGRCGKCARTNA